MLTILITLSGILMIGMSVYGGILTSAKPRHRRWFICLGILGFILVVTQGYYLYRDDQEKSQAMQKLRESVSNLREQTIALMNAIRLQATLDDFRHLGDDITAGFTHLESVIKGRKPPSLPPKPQLLPPPVVEHIRMVQRRAASTDPNSPYGLQVVLQTDVTIQPVAFEIGFDQ